MKATGIVRRIDDLGRVVIPKEIRRTLRIREGDPLEIFTDREGEIILKKYSQLETIENVSVDYVEAFNSIIKHNNKTIGSVKDLKSSDKIEIELKDGSIEATII